MGGWAAVELVDAGVPDEVGDGTDVHDVEVEETLAGEPKPDAWAWPGDAPVDGEIDDSEIVIEDGDLYTYGPPEMVVPPRAYEG